MQNILTEKLRAYIAQNNPDVLVGLQQGYTVTQYLKDKMDAVEPLLEQLLGEGKPAYIIEELCLMEMTADLRPSKYQYIREVLEADFPTEYERMAEAGVLTYELINMMEACRDVFDSYGFSEANVDDRLLRYGVIAVIHDYLN